MTTTDAPDPDAHALVQALLRLPPVEIDTAVRPISPEIADLLHEHRSAESAKHAQRMYAETMREIDHVNRERIRLFLKDQLRMLLLVDDQHFAQLAAAEMLSREPTSNRIITYANGQGIEIGYDENGTVYARIVYPGGTWDYLLPAIGRA